MKHYSEENDYEKKTSWWASPAAPQPSLTPAYMESLQRAWPGRKKVDHVYGMVNGIEGFLSGHVMDLSSLTHEDLILLKQTPAAYLGSCRFKLPENLDAPVYSLLFEKFKSMNIGACFYIGGNDSMDTVDKALTMRPDPP